MELKSFIKKLSEYTEEPSELVWEQLDQKLGVSEVNRSLYIWRWISAASVVGLLIISYLYVDHLYYEHAPGQFATNDSYSSMVLEELDILSTEDDVYSVDQIAKLYSAYRDFNIGNLQVSK